MIGAIKGTVLTRLPNALLIDVSGVGYRVAVTTDTSLDLNPGAEVFLWTHLVVRDDALELFGFGDRESLETFELLIGISGIGPKTALGILNVASPALLRQAVASEDTSYLTKVSGIGKKNAEKIVLELRDKFTFSNEDRKTNLRGESDVLEALLALGYNEHDARRVLKKLPKEPADTSSRVKAALKMLAETK
jgi:holliday junction DNA helicase RuvA